MEANHFGERYSFQWKVVLSVETIPVNRTHSVELNPENSAILPIARFLSAEIIRSYLKEDIN